MSHSFAGRDFGKSVVVGLQFRLLPHLVEWPKEWPRDECVLNLASPHVLSSCPVVWPCTIPDWEASFIVNPITGLIDAEDLMSALVLCDIDRTAVVFTRLRNEPPRRSLEHFERIPDRFEFLGYDVTNTWEGMSIISSQSFSSHEIASLRRVAGSSTNQWNLITDLQVAREVARLGATLVPEHSPFSPVEYAFCPAAEFSAQTP
jgi:hypothetical protein